MEFKPTIEELDNSNLLLVIKNDQSDLMDATDKSNLATKNRT